MRPPRIHLSDSERKQTVETLLDLSNSLLVFPGIEALKTGLISALRKLPGIEDIVVCIKSEIYPDEKGNPVCRQCMIHGVPVHDRCPYPLQNNERYQSYPIESTDMFLGYLLVRQKPTDFDIYPYLTTLAKIIAANLTHHQSKDDLKKTIDALNRAQEMAHIGHWTLDLKNNQLAWSDEVYRIFGLMPQQFGATYEAFLERVHPDDRLKVDQAYSSSVKEKKSYQIIHRVTRMDGELRYVEEKCIHEFDDVNNVIRSLGTVHDITSQILANKYRKKNERVKDMLLELSGQAANLSEQELCEKSLDIAVEITDSKIGYLHFFNEDEKTISLVAWNKETLKNCKANYDTHYPLDKAGIWADSVRFKKTVVHNDFPNTPGKEGMPEGHNEIIRHMSTPVIEKGKVKMIIGVGNKLDHYDREDEQQLQFVAEEVDKFIMRRRAEEQLEIMNQTLEQRVRDEVNRRVTQEQVLVQQSRMAAMGEMIGAIAHQWKQPLNELALIVQEIQDAYEYGELTWQNLNSNVAASLNSITFLSETIDDFRNFFKPVQAQEPFLGCESVAEVLKLVGTQFKKQNIQIIVHEHTHFYVIGFPNEFKQVLMNIFSNARDIFEERQIENRTIHVIFENDTTTGTIRISDNGGGIPEELLPDKIFEAYVTTKKNHGTGIGLQIARMIIESHMNGQIRAHNLKEGAEIVIHLPIYKMT